jgi:hypothetical protein
MVDINCACSKDTDEIWLPQIICRLHVRCMELFCFVWRLDDKYVHVKRGTKFVYFTGLSMMSNLLDIDISALIFL